MPVIAGRFLMVPSFLLKFAGVAILFCALANNGTGQNINANPDANTRLLEIGRPLQFSISNGSDASFTFPLKVGQYARITADQNGIDFKLRLYGTNGAHIADFDSDQTGRGVEVLELVGEEAGSYRIRIVTDWKLNNSKASSISLSDVRQASEDDSSLYSARVAHSRAVSLRAIEKEKEALEPALRALDIREKLLGPNDVDIASSLILVGNIYCDIDDNAKAEEFLRRAVDASKQAAGTTSLLYADALHSMAKVAFLKGELAESEKINLQALEIREKQDPDGLVSTSSIINLADIYRATSNNLKAVSMYRKGLAIREKFLGPDHYSVCLALTRLGLYYYGVGDFDEARRIFLRALKSSETHVSHVPSLAARLLNNLGLVEWRSDNLDAAVDYYQRSLSIHEKASGPNSSWVAASLVNLGSVYKDKDDLKKALEYYIRSWAIQEKLDGGYSYSGAIALNSLGLTYGRMGLLKEALEFQLRSLAVNEKIMGRMHRNTRLNLMALASLHARVGDIDRSVEFQKRIAEIEDVEIPVNSMLGSERQKINYFNQLQRVDRVISLHVNHAPNNAAARNLAITKILQRKGRVLDALSNNLATLKQRLGEDGVRLFRVLEEVNSQLSKLVVAGPRNMTVEQYNLELSQLETKRELAEREIALRSAGHYIPSHPITLAAVRSALPADTVLVEFAVYEPYDNISSYAPPRYVVYVIGPSGEVKWADLGEIEKINPAIDAFRNALRDPKRADILKLGRRVDELIMQPIRKALGKVKQILVSPDGELNLIPFEALIDENGKYLAELHQFTYLSSGRDLLRMSPLASSSITITVIANPDFGVAKLSPEANSASADTDGAIRRVRIASTGNLEDAYFGPIGGTAEEARSIRTIFPDSVVLSGNEATEARLKDLTPPGILHLATHGFFLSDEEKKTGGSSSANRNPLLRSGLAFAGANRREDGKEDGILTSLEATGLDLWGTKLVVLSACDTGLGEVRNGEGVYGLRRSFVLAGAESLVMSLWPVSDQVTRELMTGYYRNLKQNMGRGEALRQVQLQMLKRPSRRHPFYWASFIQSGEWADISGKR